MKRISVMLVLAIFIPMIFFQVSCSTTRESRSEGTPAEAVKSPEVENAPEVEKAAEVVEAPVAEVLLADTHKAGGVECSDCHKETPPANETPTEVCMTCHEDYRDVAASAIDPHNAHVEFTSCGDCHHSHRASENQCMSCHSFSLKAP